MSYFNINYSRNSFFKIWHLLNFKNKSRIFIQLILIILNGFAEISSLAIVIPFLAFLSNPEKIWDLKITKFLALLLNIKDSEQIILPLTLLFITANVIAAILRLVNIRMSSYISASIGTDLSCKIYSSTLSKKYEEHIDTNTSKIVSTSTTSLDATVAVINYFFQAIAATLVGISIVLALFFVDVQITLVALMIFGIIYGFIAISIRTRLNKNSKSIIRNRDLQVKNIQESLGGIRDIILDNLQETYLEIYRKTDQLRRIKEAENQFLALFPRFGVEAIALTVIAIFSYQLSKNVDGANILPLIGTFAFGAQRLLPSIQMAYSAWAGIKANSNAINSVVGLIKDEEYIKKVSKRKNAVQNKIFFKKSIELKNICFSYKQTNKFKIENLNLIISKGERIGIIGQTGCGKSTLVDIIMGILEPSSGEVKVDDVNIHSKKDSSILYNWFLNVSHVPQNIYLSDKTILENIAFGVKYKNINIERAKNAAKVAGIDNFINKLDLKYYSMVGEDGIKISGGQRQRIGIARAIYKNSSILILDEATSSLDNKTEANIMDSINKISRDTTIIIIAHRLSTIQDCDRLICIKEGKILEDGIPEEVLRNSKIS